MTDSEDQTPGEEHTAKRSCDTGDHNQDSTSDATNLENIYLSKSESGKNNLSDNSDNNISDVIAKLVTKNLIHSLDDEIDIDYQSAIPATKLILSLVFAAIMAAWMMDAITDYRMPKIVYGLAISSSMSIVFVAADLGEVLNNTYGIPFASDDIADFTTYNIIIRYCGVIFFFLGFFVQLNFLYFASAYEVSSRLLASPLPIFGEITYDGLLDFLFLSVLGITSVITLGVRESIVFIGKHIFVPSVLILSLAFIGQIKYGDLGSAVVLTSSIFIILLLYVYRIVRIFGDFAANRIRISQKPDEEFN